MIIFLVYNIKCLLLFFSKYLNTSNLIIFLKIEFYEYFWFIFKSRIFLLITSSIKSFPIKIIISLYWYSYIIINCIFKYV